MSGIQREKPQRRQWGSANALWVSLFIVGLVLQVLLLNYLNKVLMLTYELQGNATFAFSSAEEAKQFQERLARKAEQENTRFVSKFTDGFIGGGLDSDNPAKYRFLHFGYCNFRTCVSAANHFEPYTFNLSYYDNWLFAGDDNKEVRVFIKAI